MASLLLGSANVLVLDEPGNHLDVETVEALAEALRLYKGTVVFTSHDRHFMARVATNVIEVRDGRVRNYFGSYDTYCEAVEKEVEEGERARNAAAGKPGGKSPGKSSGDDGRKDHRDQRKTGKELKTLERKIAKLDGEKRELNDKAPHRDQSRRSAPVARSGQSDRSRTQRSRRTLARTQRFLVRCRHKLSLHKSNFGKVGHSRMPIFEMRAYETPTSANHKHTGMHPFPCGAILSP